MASDGSNTPQIDDLSPENDIIPEMEGEAPLEILESDIDEDYSPVTPYQKIDSLKANSREPMSETFVGSVVGSSDLSIKECSETTSSFSSSSLSDAESGTYNSPPKNYSLQYEKDDEIMKPKIISVDGNNEVVLKKMDGLEYDELLERVASFEIELKFAKKKLESKQEEVAQLKYENLTLVENLRTSEDNMAKMEENFTKELQKTRHQLVTELDSERRLVSDLQGILVKKTKDLGEYGREIDELKHALRDSQEHFSKNRSKFESEIAHLHRQRDVLDAKVEESELRNKFLKEEIKTLKEDLCQRHGTIECLNKTLDIVKSEKDEYFAKMQKLEAEMNHRDTKLAQMQERMRKLSTDNEEIVSELKKTRKKAEDQEKELEKLGVVINERGDEKREAIKQLCFSLEYYRNEYLELCQTFNKQKPRAVLC